MITVIIFWWAMKIKAIICELPMITKTTIVKHGYSKNMLYDKHNQYYRAIQLCEPVMPV